MSIKKMFLSLLLAAVSVSCTQNRTEDLDLIPFPASVEPGRGAFDVSGASFGADSLLGADVAAAADAFRMQLTAATGEESQWKEDVSEASFAFCHDASLGKEEYILDITPRKVTVTVSGLNGAVYALETVRQLLPAGIYAPESGAEGPWKLPALKICDKPRFSYRGLHLDPARHFFDLTEVKRYIDVMVMHKMNTLHWHLTDDQGWRIEIKRYPKLTEVGGYRDKTLIGHLNSGQGYEYGRYGGFYTQDEIREVVRYAASKGVTVIPEIDLPGHMLAALAAYPEYGCTGGPYEVWGRWGVSDDVLCVGKESTFEFIEGILTEVMELFPSEYIHIGGDECPKVRWEKCPACQARIRQLGLKDTEEHTAEHYLQSYVTARVEKFLNSHGRKIIGWDEILEGELAPNATVMSWRGVGGGIQAARLGHDAIMTPNTYFYLDYCQSADMANEPISIGGYLPVEKCYSYEPYAKNMTEEEKAHIIGVQANLWTEYIKTPEHLEYMLLPRAAALAEVQWCQPENKSWDRFVSSIRHYTDIYDILGYNYARHIFDAKGKVTVNPEGTVVRYTTDGTEPDAGSPVYRKPISVKGSCTILAKSDVEGTKTKKYVFEGHKAMGRPVVVDSKPSPSYGRNMPDLLVDGVRGGLVFANGQWAGWQSSPVKGIPAWHAIAAGRPAFIFVDEIIVK